MFKKRQSLIKPIQDDVYEACKKVCEERGFQMIMDRASSQSIIFASPRIDVSNEVLEKMGLQPITDAQPRQRYTILDMLQNNPFFFCRRIVTNHLRSEKTGLSIKPVASHPNLEHMLAGSCNRPRP